MIRQHSDFGASEGDAVYPSASSSKDVASHGCPQASSWRERGVEQGFNAEDTITVSSVLARIIFDASLHVSRQQVSFQQLGRSPSCHCFSIETQLLHATLEQSGTVGCVMGVCVCTRVFVTVSVLWLACGWRTFCSYVFAHGCLLRILMYRVHCLYIICLLLACRCLPLSCVLSALFRLIHFRHPNTN